MECKKETVQGWCGCPSCKKNYNSAYWRKNKDVLLMKRRTDFDRARNARYMQKSRLKKKIKALRIAGRSCCERCSVDDPRVLHFHHLDPLKKNFGIMAKLSGSYKVDWDEITEEIKKCEIICANCHLIEHCLWDEDVLREALRLSGGRC